MDTSRFKLQNRTAIHRFTFGRAGLSTRAGMDMMCSKSGVVGTMAKRTGSIKTQFPMAVQVKTQNSIWQSGERIGTGIVTS